MRTKLTSLIVAVFLWPVAAYAADKVDLFDQGDSHTMYHWEVSPTRFESLPAWSPSSDAPPLAIAKAVAIATRWIKERNPKLDDFKPTGITLQQSSAWLNGNIAEHWYYRIEFHPVINGESLYGGTYVAVVLFDGTVVEPRAEKEAR